MSQNPHIPETLTQTSAGTAGAEHLTNAVIWAYSVPRIGFGIMGLLFSTYLMKFSTDVLLIAPAAMGGLIAASRLWDAVSDPMAGYFSDRTRSRFGRRRSWMYVAAIPMSIGLVMIWSPPNSLEGLRLIAWMGLALLVYETASTAFFVPHGALGVELTPNYHERTRLYGYAHMIGAIGSVLGLISLYFLNSAEDKRLWAFGLSSVAGVSVALLVIGSTTLLPEREDFQGRGAESPFKSFTDVFRNPHSFLLLLVFGIETFGSAVIGMLVPYLIDYVIPLEKMPVAPSLFLVAILVTYIVPQFAFAPLWIWLSRFTGKKLLWATALGMNAVIFLGYYFSLEAPVAIWILTFFLGLSSGIGAVVAPAIQADVIDYDEFLTGDRKEGTYLAVWNLVRKGAASVTALITGFVLQFVGFEPNAEQTAETQYALRALFSLLPSICFAIGTILFLKFSLNEREHAEVRAQLALRAQAAVK